MLGLGARDDHRVLAAAGGGIERAAAVRAEVRAAEDGAPQVQRGTLVAVEQLVDLGEPRVDADELRAALVQEVFAKAAAAVDLDQQPAEVAELLLADLQKRAALAAEQARHAACAE